MAEKSTRCQNHRPASDHSVAKNSADTVGAGVFPVRLFSAALRPRFPSSVEIFFLATLALVYPLWRI